ncbi:Uncharacterised protein [Mycobacterium tuberculosis]|nr:Uncharacterised protein [Mycobacterium tuberculosis]
MVLTSSSSTWAPLKMVGNRRSNLVRESDWAMVMSSRPSEWSALGQINNPPP